MSENNSVAKVLLTNTGQKKSAYLHPKVFLTMCEERTSTCDKPVVCRASVRGALRTAEGTFGPIFPAFCQICTDACCDLQSNSNLSEAISMSKERGNLSEREWGQVLKRIPNTAWGGGGLLGAWCGNREKGASLF